MMEIDSVVADKLFGIGSYPFPYSTSPIHIVDILEALRVKGFLVLIFAYPGPVKYAVNIQKVGGGLLGKGIGEELPMAFCKAVLELDI
jgi:hypothetical protein